MKKYSAKFNLTLRDISDSVYGTDYEEITVAGCSGAQVQVLLPVQAPWSEGHHQ